MPAVECPCCKSQNVASPPPAPACALARISARPGPHLPPAPSATLHTEKTVPPLRRPRISRPFCRSRCAGAVPSAPAGSAVADRALYMLWAVWLCGERKVQAGGRWTWAG